VIPQNTRTDCGQYLDPCECLYECGWSTTSGSCVASTESQTSCEECPSLSVCDVPLAVAFGRVTNINGPDTLKLRSDMAYTYRYTHTCTHTHTHAWQTQTNAHTHTRARTSIPIEIYTRRDKYSKPTHISIHSFLQEAAVGI
jgi:hypothetical protein